MRQRKTWFAMSGTLAVLAIILILPMSAGAASQYKVLYRFKPSGDGANPLAQLIFDSRGNLYGTTNLGGANGFGTVFRLTPGANGTWTETVLYDFCAALNCADGAQPAAGLIFDTGGNLYGTTETYGAHGPSGGTVFRLAPTVKGKWTHTILYSFCAVYKCKDGSQPWAGLIFDAAGSLYGTTFGGGVHQGGTVFKLTPGAKGKWIETVLHSFCAAKCTDGADPFASLIFDAAGNLYGTAANGGTYFDGTVFKLTPGAKGQWTYTLLFTFNGKSGAGPVAGLISDAAGNLYGTADTGGDLGCNSGIGCGVVFKLAPGANGKWIETILHAFHSVPAYPVAGLILDAAGNLYGTASEPVAGHFGVVFKLTPNANGKWTYTVPHTFNGKDGAGPMASLISDASGNLYGTAASGGDLTGCSGSGCGVVFEIAP